MQTNNTTNMKDKHGNALKVGDRVVYRKGTKFQDFGTVVEREGDYGDVWTLFDANPCATFIASKDIELIKEITETSSEFTPEDESLLQQLLAKKQKYSEDKAEANVRYSSLINQLYDVSSVTYLSSYIKQNIDQICDTLQTYKKYFG